MTDNLWESRSVNNRVFLKGGELHIWRTKISDNVLNINEYLDLLTIEEQAKAQSFFFRKDQNRYVITRAILKKLLAMYLNVISPRCICFKQTNYGKPYLVDSINNENIKFNISHSNDCVVFAFTKNIDVGVDIEYIDKNLVIEEIIEYCCTELEKNQLNELPYNHRYYYFYKLWVLKEAIVKALGLGLSFDLKQIRTDFYENKLISFVDIIDNNKLCWTANTFYAYNSYYSAFAVKSSTIKVIFFTYLIS